MTNYHHTVILNATPFGDFTKWCKPKHTAAMVRQDIRRAALRAAIDQEFEGNVSRFAAAAGKSQSQIADMLDGRKPFGEKVARSIEGALGWSAGRLDERYQQFHEVRDSGPSYAARRMGVPVVGTAQLGDGGFWTELGHPVGAGDGSLDARLRRQQKVSN